MQVKAMNNTVKVSDIFTAIYGVNLELINLSQCKSTDFDAVPFVSRSEKNNGVASFVQKESSLKLNSAHTLSLAGSGSVLTTFYQPLPYYSGRDLYILIPKKKLSVIQMLFYAKCISSNRYKYNYGRQANKTLKNILIPKDIPNTFDTSLTSFYHRILRNVSDASISKDKIKLNVRDWKCFKLTNIFRHKRK